MQGIAAQAVGVKLLPQRLHICRLRLVQQVGYALALEISQRGDAIMRTEGAARLLPQELQHLLIGEGVVLALLPLAIRILGAVKAAQRPPHLPKDVVRRFPRSPAIKGRACQRVGPAISQDQQGVVIEHLLKMGHEEAPVRGIAAKAVADVVEQTALIHLYEGFFRHGQALRLPCGRVMFQQKQKLMAHRKLGRGAEAAISFVKMAGEPINSPPNQALRPIRTRSLRRPGGFLLPHKGRNFIRALKQGGTILQPFACDGR